MARTDLPYLESRLNDLDKEWDNLERRKVTPQNKAAIKRDKAILLRHIEYIEKEIKYQKSKVER